MSSAKIEDYQDDQAPPNQPPPPPSNYELGRQWTETIFPMKLYDILCNPEFHHAISWMPHGRSWKVLNKDFFMEEICPQYFAQTRYESFIRQVNGWGFKRMRREGPDRSSYYHEHFLRGYPNLIDHMRRPAPGEKSRDLREEPDFYSLNPMPELPPRHGSVYPNARHPPLQSSSSVGGGSGGARKSGPGRPVGSSTAHLAAQRAQNSHDAAARMALEQQQMAGVPPTTSSAPAAPAQPPPAAPPHPYAPYPPLPPAAWGAAAPPPWPPYPGYPPLPSGYWPQTPPMAAPPFRPGYPPPGYPMAGWPQPPPGQPLVPYGYPPVYDPSQYYPGYPHTHAAAAAMASASQLPTTPQTTSSQTSASGIKRQRDDMADPPSSDHEGSSTKRPHSTSDSRHNMEASPSYPMPPGMHHPMMYPPHGMYMNPGMMGAAHPSLMEGQDPSGGGGAPFSPMGQGQSSGGGQGRRNAQGREDYEYNHPSGNGGGYGGYGERNL